MGKKKTVFKVMLLRWISDPKWQEGANEQIKCQNVELHNYYLPTYINLAINWKIIGYKAYVTYKVEKLEAEFWQGNLIFLAPLFIRCNTRNNKIILEGLGLGAENCNKLDPSETFCLAKEASGDCS
jgi:hypothetical protein